MKKLSLKKLDFGTHEVLQKDQLKSVFGGYGHPGPGGADDDLMCFNRIEYDDGYWYVANQGDDINTCRNLVNTSYTDSHGTFTVKDCFCTSYA